MVVIVGGVREEVGGWNEYVAGSRAEEAARRGPRVYQGAYGGAEYATPRAGLESLLRGAAEARRRRPPLETALLNAARALERRAAEDAAWDADAVTPEDMRAFAADLKSGAAVVTDPDALEFLAEVARTLQRAGFPLAALEAPPPAARLPRRAAAATSNVQAMADLEKSVAPAAEAVEEYAGRVAAWLDAAVSRAAPPPPTRGASQSAPRVASCASCSGGAAVASTVFASADFGSADVVQAHTITPPAAESKLFSSCGENDIRLGASEAVYDQNEADVGPVGGTVFDDAVDGSAFDGAFEGGAPKAPTRGAEVAAAAARLPSRRALAGGLPFTGVTTFDIVSGEIVSYREGLETGTLRHGMRAGLGLYVGFGMASLPDRSTRLHPHNIVVCATQTSMGAYAWYVFDVAEGIIATRADPVDGRPVRLQLDGLIDWVAANARGNPPHKIPFWKYIKWLRETVGLRVAVILQRDKWVRFDVRNMVAPGALQAQVAALARMTQDDFDALDWREYDRAVVRRMCRAPHEFSGEMLIADGRVRVPKIRRGTLSSTSIWPRSLIVFHSHPANRYKGQHAEPPSAADLHHIVFWGARGVLGWHFIAAPEGTYICRPSASLVDAYTADWERVEARVREAYVAALRELVSPLAEYVRAVCAIIENLGYVVRFRAAGCRFPAPAGPGSSLAFNALVRSDVEAARARVARLTGAQLAALDWSVVASDVLASRPEQSDSCSQVYLPRRTTTLQSGDSFHQQLDEPGGAFAVPSRSVHPILAYISGAPRDDPTTIPRAALDVASQYRGEWLWFAVVDPLRVTVLRFDKAGRLEVHGPVRHRSKVRPPARES
jgi:hypothetical protein